MMSLSDDKQADVIGAFNTTSRYLDDISNINQSPNLIKPIPLIPKPYLELGSVQYQLLMRVILVFEMSTL